MYHRGIKRGTTKGGFDPVPVIWVAKTYVTCDSRVVPHRSTEQAQGCLTSEFGWDPVLPPWFDRQMGGIDGILHKV